MKNIDRSYVAKYWPLYLLLLVAAILRFWQLDKVPFMHDEFSALFRTDYDSFSELIRLGVMQNDSHPAGVQVFLYYWIKLVGFNAFWIKLPFAMLGVGSVFLVYKLSKQWFGELPALLSAAFVATVQFFVFYSQLARPYAAGQFFVLLLAVQLYPWIKKKAGIKDVLIFGFTAFLASIMHAFSLAQAGIIVLTLFIAIPKFNRKAFWFAVLLASVLYAPQLPVFLFQLGEGGIGGWLGTPQADFLLHFLYYAFNYSWYLIVVVAGLLLLSVLANGKANTANPIARWVGLLWFVAPLAVAWGYSVWRTPILQFSTLYFSFPFLVIVMFSFIKIEVTRSWKAGLFVSIILISGTASLVFERQHFKLMQNQGFDQLALEMKKSEDKANGQIALASYSATPAMAAFYQDIQGLKNVKRFSKHDSIQKFGDWLVAQRKNKLGFGWTDYAPAEWEQLAALYYPGLEHEEGWFNAFWRLGSRKSKAGSKVFDIPFDGKLSFDYGNTYGPAWVPDSNVINNKTQIFGIAVKLKHISKVSKIRLVVELRDNQSDSLLHWQAGTLEQAWTNDTSSIWLSALRFTALGLKPETLHIRSYIWNKEGENFEVVKASFYSRRNHPYILGLAEPL